MCFIPFSSFLESCSLSLSLFLSESPSLTSLCHLCIPLQTSLNSLFSKGPSGFGCLAWPYWPLIGDAGTTSLWGQKHLSPLTAVQKYTCILTKYIYICRWRYNNPFPCCLSFQLNSNLVKGL